MATAKIDLKNLELPSAARTPLYAGVGATDLAVERVREIVADVQKRLVGAQKDVQTRVADAQKNVRDPKGLRDQLAKDAPDRRAAVEARVAELRKDAREQVGTVTGTYVDLAKRGEDLVNRVRKQEATKATKSSAKTTTAKAKTTQTQGTKSAKKTTKKATSTAKKSSGPARSSAKATTTSAKKTASNATKATQDAASKVGN